VGYRTGLPEEGAATPTEMLPNSLGHPGLEALEDGFYMLDSAACVTYWNAAASRMVGVPASEVVGRVLWERLPHLEDGPTRELLERVLVDRSPRRFLEPHPPAREGYFEARATPTRDGGVAVVFRDATEELRLADRYSAFLESIRDGFLAMDCLGRIVYVNHIAESLLRMPRERVLGALIWPHLPSRPAEIAQTLRLTLEDGIQRHLREVRPEGRVFRGRVFDVWIYPLAGGGVSLLFEDVSERVQRELELARLAASAQEANRAKSRFFAAISHELRTPLNAIVGYTHLLAGGTYGSLPSPARRAADRTGVCAEHLARLVDDVLLMTTADIGRLPVVLHEVAVAGFLEQVVEPLRQQAQAKGLEFRLEAPEPRVTIETDPERLRQILVALLSNAIKFTPSGSVRVSGEVVATGPEPVLEFAVADSGPGIPEQDRDRVFHPFEQLCDPARSDSLTRGTGLGLTVARQLTGLLGGAVAVHDSSLGGAEFRVRLPLTAERPEASPGQSGPPSLL
jgi:PAS domain S-box-containing protein